MRQLMLPSLPVISGTLCALLLAACDSGSDSKPPSAPAAASAPVANPVPVPASQSTNAEFLGSMSEKHLGDQWGLVELRPNGILIHPGATKPTIVRIPIGERKTFRAKGFIAELNAEGNAYPKAGIVDVTVRLDGKVVTSTVVDRKTPANLEANLSGANLLEISIGNGNGDPGWDWFTLDVTEMK